MMLFGVGYGERLRGGLGPARLGHAGNSVTAPGASGPLTCIRHPSGAVPTGALEA
jgi:hypothetical protein